MSSFNKGSYTEYGNKIGLYSNSDHSFISSAPDVVLNFPYKDCVLVGGMTKEDAKRDERFLNTKVDQRDIDTLFEPKVLTDFKYVDQSGERTLTANDNIEFFDENGELKQNLLIKGNNLIALHTLRQRLAGKVKLIYIDPPYNTGNDGFSYNDQFSHSAWLVFMNDRLRAARDLLADDGIMMVQLDYHEVHYGKVLMDEIFGRDNFVNEIIWRYGKMNNTFRKFPSNHDNILVYSKTPDEYTFNPQKTADSEYRNRFLRFLTGNKVLYGTVRSSADKLILGRARRVQNELGRPLRDDDVLFDFDKEFKLQDDVFYDISIIKGNSAEKIENFTQKPEKLMERLIACCTAPGDIVLDYHLGSGTTAAVAQKMGRRWIGIEQMDYIETIAKERMKKVIAGEQGGISKSVGWQGGGSFVYLELKKYNEDYKERILAAETATELDAIRDDMLRNAFLKFWINRKDLNRDWYDEEINERKVELINMLDENQLYLNYADMNDAKYSVTANEKALTDRFYGANDDSEDDDDGAN